MQDSRCEVAALDAMLCICLLPPQLLLPVATPIVERLHQVQLELAQDLMSNPPCNHAAGDLESAVLTRQ